MNEAHPRGPLDIVRHIDGTAHLVDGVVDEYLSRNPEQYGAVIRQIRGLHEAHPLIGQAVGIHGVPLSIALEGEAVVDDETLIPYVLPIDRATATTYGIYAGIVLRNMHDSEADAYGYRLAHKLYVDSDEPELDDYGDVTHRQRYSYVCVQGSEVSPVLPVNAHSLDDLGDDPVIELIDEIVLSEGADNLEKIIRLGSEVNEILAQQEFFESAEINHQRASYINAIGLHDQLQLEFNDVLIAEDEATDDMAAIILAGPAHITPAMFDIASGYHRMSNSEDVLGGGPPELYARVILPDGRLLMAALKNVLDVHTLEGDT